jgi:hypothetical protein
VANSSSLGVSHSNITIEMTLNTLRSAGYTIPEYEEDQHVSGYQSGGLHYVGYLCALDVLRSDICSRHLFIPVPLVTSQNRPQSLRLGQFIPQWVAANSNLPLSAVLFLCSC